MTWLCNRLPQDWQWPGARRKHADEIAAEAVDLFALPLLVTMPSARPTKNTKLFP